MSQRHPFFPVNLSCHWQDPEQFNLSNTLQNWLLDPSSLTARLKSHCQNFQVEVLGQTIEPCHQNEAMADIKSGDDVLVREVLLYCDNVAQVFARSLLPLSSLTGEEQQLAHLGTQPLGQVLFNNPLLKREAIQIGCLNHNSSVTKLAQSLNLYSDDQLWGRRSLFRLNNKPLIVAEVFLPNAFAYQ
jgi:chorismate--pyruvate lyase